MAVVARRAYRIRGRDIPLHDLLLVGAGVFMLAVSLLPWYGYDADGWHPTHTAFQSGFEAFFSVWFVVLIAGAAATRAWNGHGLTNVGTTGLSWNAVFLIGDGIAALLILLFATTLPGLDGASVGAKPGAYLGFVAVAVQAAGGLLALLSAGERLRLAAVATRAGELRRRLRRRPASG